MIEINDKLQAVILTLELSKHFTSKMDRDQIIDMAVDLLANISGDDLRCENRLDKISQYCLTADYYGRGAK